MKVIEQIEERCKELEKAVENRRKAEKAYWKKANSTDERTLERSMEAAAFYGTRVRERNLRGDIDSLFSDIVYERADMEGRSKEELIGLALRKLDLHGVANVRMGASEIRVRDAMRLMEALA